jgi:hypothetical protein
VSTPVESYTTPSGITFLDNTGAHSLYAFQELGNNHVYALGASQDQASRDQLVAGTLGGLSLLASAQIRKNLTTATSGLKHNWVTGLAAVGNEWLVGTYSDGVKGGFSYSPRVHSLTLADKHSKGDITAVTEALAET